MKVRTISAIIALLIFIPLIWVGGYIFAGAMGILSVLAYKEIIDLKKSHQELPNVVKVLGLISTVYLVLGNYGTDMINYGHILVPIFLLLLPTIFYKKDRYQTKDAFYLAGAVILIGLFFNLLIVIRNVNVNILIYLLCITIVTDTFAFLIGMLIGKHKMSPNISPLKSWEGAIGGLIAGVVISMLVYVNLIAPFSFYNLIMTIVLSIVGQMGDLVFSKIKRENGIKDFSNIMPGHGGILDRVDSIIFVIFAYMIIINLF